MNSIVEWNWISDQARRILSAIFLDVGIALHLFVDRNPYPILAFGEIVRVQECFAHMNSVLTKHSEFSSRYSSTNHMNIDSQYHEVHTGTDMRIEAKSIIPFPRKDISFCVFWHQFGNARSLRRKFYPFQVTCFGDQEKKMPNNSLRNRKVPTTKGNVLK